jgi:hypothetical protein
MWQEILVFAILIVAGGLTLWRFYEKFTGKASCCGGGCTCKGSCGSGAGGSPRAGGCGDGLRMSPLSGDGCGCSR